MSSAESDKIASLMGLTGMSESMAIQTLASHNWEVEQAVTNYYESLEGGDPAAAELEVDEPDSEIEEDMRMPPNHPDGPPPTSAQSTASSNFLAGGGRRLGDDSSAPIPSTSTPISAPAPKPKKKAAKPKSKITSFKDIRDRETEEDEDDDEDKPQEFYAGGDKSGLAVTDPNSGDQGHNDQVRRLLETARRNGPVAPLDPAGPSSRFTGSGQTLGGDDTPSTVISNPNAAAPRAAPMVERTLHLWEDGFSIDDGPLFRYDDPRNRHTLEMINRGSAPLDLMDVEPGQAVDVRLDEHRGEKYVQPKKKYTPFGGSGQRLGSPVPGEASAAKPATKTTTTSSAASSASSSGPQTMNVDDTQPTISLQIRLGDGSRLVSRFNTTHTIGDVYDFVSRANPGSSARSYVLAATFPTKDLTDKAQVLGEMAEYKRGGVIVQKWT